MKKDHEELWPLYFNTSLFRKGEFTILQLGASLLDSFDMEIFSCSGTP